MILIVADTGPINYLIQIGHVEILQTLATRIVLPEAVLTELKHARAPQAVNSWAQNPPAWIEVLSASHPVQERHLSLADSEAISLAMELNAALLLMDDRLARQCAEQRGVTTIGTVGLLEAAARRGLLSLREALERLRLTSCYLPDELIENVLRRENEAKEI